MIWVQIDVCHLLEGWVPSDFDVKLEEGFLVKIFQEKRGESLLALAVSVLARLVAEAHCDEGDVFAVNFVV